MKPREQPRETEYTETERTKTEQAETARAGHGI